MARSIKNIGDSPFDGGKGALRSEIQIESWKAETFLSHEDCNKGDTVLKNDVRGERKREGEKVREFLE